MSKLHYSSMSQFNKYDLSPEAIKSSKLWEQNHMYNSSTFMMSEKNVIKFN